MAILKCLHLKGNEYKDLLKTISEMNNPKLNEEGKCCEEGKSL